MWCLMLRTNILRQCQKVKEVADLAAYTEVTDQAVSILTGNSELFEMACALTSDVDANLIDTLYTSLSAKYGTEVKEVLFQQGRQAAINNQLSVLQDQIEIGCQYMKSRKQEIKKICRYVERFMCCFRFLCMISSYTILLYTSVVYLHGMYQDRHWGITLLKPQKLIGTMLQ